MLLIVLGTFAASFADNAIAVYPKNGKVVYFLFADDPIVSYSGNDLVITTNSTTVRYDVSNLRKLEFAVGEKDAIEKVTVDLRWAIENRALAIHGGTPLSWVRLYDMSGAKVSQFQLDGKGNGCTPLQDLPSGVYVVKADNLNFKFVKN